MGREYQWLLSVSLVLSLAACGGGGSSSAANPASAPESGSNTETDTSNNSGEQVLLHSSRGGHAWAEFCDGKPDNSPLLPHTSRQGRADRSRPRSARDRAYV
ncbi:hypothetical protein [Zhongshania marina]|uniref:hypothetical protein n=1 Tax=Zhongshania marina TaxID=2304603 RepID=UPI0011AF106E|nr:hypothetical protein [Marortus luteolus]